MNRLLCKDSIDFEKLHPSATRFLTGAHLRYECYCLKLHENSGMINDWSKNRLSELLMSPACQVKWFQKLINE